MTESAGDGDRIGHGRRKRLSVVGHGHNRRVNRWTPALAATALACVPIALEHATSPELLQDSDTKVLLHALRIRHNPWSWFAGDWPLQNHFYRPVSTLTFEWDQHTYGANAAGYGWTNDILCILCVFLLLWFVRELTDRPLFAGAAAVLFASWQWTGVNSVALFGALAATLLLASLVFAFVREIRGPPLLAGGLALLFAVCCWNPESFAEVSGATLTIVVGGLFAYGLVKRRQILTKYLLPALAIPFLLHEFVGKEPLAPRMIDWLPGRTASVMSIFGLIALAAYTRYERISAERKPEPEPTPLTPPATRNTEAKAKPMRRPWIWIVVSALGLALAMASYEQGIMIAPALTAVALVLSLMGYRTRWAWQGLFWGLLGGYLVLRHQLVPSAPSGYQLQQFRHGPGVFLDLSTYIFPPAGSVPNVFASWDPSLGIGAFIMGGALIGFLVSTAQTVSAIGVLKRRWVLAFAGWGLSWGIFCPMAWLKHFDHYDYLPMAMRTIFVLALAWSVWEAVSTALRPQALQAPPRPSPAPGSLPHP